MSTNHTQHYQLSQWLATDKVERTDFNADNAKLDTALHALDSRAAALESVKADKTALSALSTAVSAKAEQTALSSLENTVRQKANARDLDALEVAVLRYTAGTYLGNGAYNSANARSLDFSQTLGRNPLLVLIAPQNNANGKCLLLLCGMTQAANSLNGLYSTSTNCTVTWSGNTVRWYASSADGMLNENGVTYQYFALG